VTRKITRAIAHILAGRQEKLYLGKLAASRDWGYAPEYVEGMWRILQQDCPEDFVLGTGESHSIEEFVTEAFGYAGLGSRELVETDPRYIRPAEVDILLADASKARAKLGWEPKINFRELVRIMVDADMESLGLKPVGEGFRILEEKFGAWHQCGTILSLPTCGPRQDRQSANPLTAIVYEFFQSSDPNIGQNLCSRSLRTSWFSTRALSAKERLP
jgi:GDPmannose 4,6-dehydratase